MATREVDWRFLRGAIIWFVIAVLLSAGALGGTHYFAEQAARDYERQKIGLVDVRGRYLRLDEERRMLETLLPQFELLESKGIVGDEHRLDWTETLRDVSKELKLPRLRYEISTRGQYQPEFPLDPGTFQVYASEMRLDMGLLHEQDLKAVLAALDKQDHGIFSVSRCAMSRAQADISQDPTTPNLKAECLLRWFTLNLPGTEGNVQ